MKSMKKLAFSLLMLIAIFALAACGNNDNNEDQANKDEKNNDTASLYDQIMEEGVLTVGTEGTYPPYTFHDESGKLTGYDVEVIREVAERMELEVKFEETQWDAMFSGLNAKRFDLIANQVGINDDRKSNYDFSIPYTYTSAVVVVPKDNTDINSFEDMKGKKSAQSLTSNYGEIARENGAELVAVDGLFQSIELIKQGRADVTTNDRLAVLDYIKQEGGEDIKIVAEADEVTEIALTFNKGNEELVEAVNKQLEAMKEDGTLTKIAEEWFGEDVSSK
jgi:L-cystine transport system substrate-binding protein